MPPSPKSVILTGASGMIGGMILQVSLNSEAVAKVTSLVRKPSGTTHPKLKEVVVKDFMTYDDVKADLIGQDVAFFCIGVYTGAVPRDEFRKITVDYPVNFAKALHAMSPQATFCLLSGAGADRNEKSRLMFAKDKGAAENQLAAIGFKAFHTFRPGYIYPDTPRQEPNLSYRIMRKLYPLIKLMGPGQSIKASELANVMFRIGMEGGPKEVYENREMVLIRD
ncbi:MAG: NAD(P)H-binding protein [Flavobacteriales bacterium]|nr:NAD(P)H-binding protein [Flavobacteriales bacterium]